MRLEGRPCLYDPPATGGGMHRNLIAGLFGALVLANGGAARADLYQARGTAGKQDFARLKAYESAAHSTRNW